MKFELAVLLAGSAALASAQQTEWGQCGGIGWTGPTTCVSGTTCTYNNAYYSQCLPGGNGNPTTTTTTPTKTTTRSTTTTTPSVHTTTTSSKTTTTSSKTTTTSSKTTTTTTAASGPHKFTYFGTNESGAEFGNTAIPGQLGKDYTWPSPSSIDYFMSNGFNTFRIPTMMERIAPPPTGMTGPFNLTYVSGLDTIVSYITGKGGYAIVDPHNFGRYNGNIITDTSGFQTFWQTLASRYASNGHVIFDTNNEYHDMDQSLVFSLNQAAINGIRAAGATEQLILVEGNSYTGAWTWISSGNAASLISLTDPNHNFAYEMHQYLDSDGSGTSAVCVNNTIMESRLEAATQWCVQNNVRCFLGELGSGTDSVCTEALDQGIAYMQQSGAWIGLTWWGAGPWWGTYYQSIEPPSGPALSVIVPLLESFE